jgi:LacI family transcriptional regulator
VVTLKDIAAEVGVSVKTVSRVINRDPAVSQGTRDAVMLVVRRRRYLPNHAARLLHTEVAPTVGLITDRIATTPFSVDIIRGAQMALQAQARTMVIVNHEGDRQAEASCWQLFRSCNVAGVIYATMFHRPIELDQPDFFRNIVLANCYSMQRNHPSILPDDEGGGYRQARHLIELGHRRIGVITLNPAIRATVLRGAGYRSAFAEAGLTFDPSLELAGSQGPVGNDHMVATEAATTLLTRADRPTAIICGNDQTAVQVYATAANLGLSIPEDLSVIGFDDMQVISTTLRPMLSSVALPYFDIGRIAVEVLSALSDGSEGAMARQILVPCPLVERQSCRPLA